MGTIVMSPSRPATPRLDGSAGTITTSPLGLTTRAFLRSGDAWVDEDEATNGTRVVQDDGRRHGRAHLRDASDG
ncbi:MAG: hypothetical protein JNM69_29930, partial [Archangium sp.]|nr:hypothetical protein [Archangium sp.]